MFAKVQENHGPEVTGVGSFPLLLVVNSDSDSAVAISGDERATDAVFMSTPDGGAIEAVCMYLEKFGLVDFKNVSHIDADLNFLRELVVAAIDKDPGDFEFENGVPLSIVSSTSPSTELAPLVGLLGVWVLCRDGLDISVDLETKELTIDGDLYTDIGVVFGEVLFGNSEDTAAILHQKAQ